LPAALGSRRVSTVHVLDDFVRAQICHRASTWHRQRHSPHDSRRGHWSKSAAMDRPVAGRSADGLGTAPRERTSIPPGRAPAMLLWLDRGWILFSATLFHYLAAGACAVDRSRCQPRYSPPPT